MTDAKEPMKQIILTITSCALLFVLFGQGESFASGSGHEHEQEAQSANSDSSDELLVTLEIPLASPLFSKTPVAVVNEEPITVGDLTRRIASTHMGREEGSTSTRKNYTRLLERVITTQLVIEEARNIGLDELPKVESQIEDFAARTLASELISPQLDAVVADPAEVDALYSKLAREFLLTALEFAKQEDAMAFEAQLKSAENFNELAARFLEDGRAEGELDSRQYMKLKDLLPNIAKTAFEMEAGDVSQIFSVPEGFMIFYVEDVRPYEDADAREEARQTVLMPLHRSAADAYITSLIVKHATIDEGLVDAVDFDRESSGVLWFRKEKPVDFQNLRDDPRVLATVHDEEPFVITVGDVARKVEERRHHGVEEAAEARKLNDQKKRVLRDMVFRKVILIEARQRGLDQSEEYLEQTREFTNSLLFNTFVSMVVAPDVKIREEDARAHYEENKADFSTPTMFRMDGLAFEQIGDAKSAIAKLRKGADFKWVSANSPGQLDREKAPVNPFDDALLSLTALPEDLHHAAEGGGVGDALLYTSPEEIYYAISIREVYPAEPRPYETVRNDIAQILFQEKLEELIADWGDKLREAYETRIFVKGLDS